MSLISQPNWTWLDMAHSCTKVDDVNRMPENNETCTDVLHS